MRDSTTLREVGGLFLCRESERGGGQLQTSSSGLIQCVKGTVPGIDESVGPLRKAIKKKARKKKSWRNC